LRLANSSTIKIIKSSLNICILVKQANYLLACNIPHKYLITVDRMNYRKHSLISTNTSVDTGVNEIVSPTYTFTE